MSEISRERAIRELRVNYLGDPYKLRDAKDKAISDMEKLEKIEQLYEPKPFGEGLSREDRDKEIEKIVKG